eukprot:jgi/Bigna1/145449/aug1.99_g20157
MTIPAEVLVALPSPRYGSKYAAVELVQEWMRTIGAKAGLNDNNCRLLSGAVGVKESRLEMEVDMPSFAALETFWSSIPMEEHMDWSERMKPHMVDGSPEWQVYRKLAATTSSSSPTNLQQEMKESGGLEKIRGLYDDDEEEDEGEETGEEKMIFDMEGKPIKLNKGDKIPDLAPEGAVSFGEYTFIMPEGYKPYVPPSPEEVLPPDELRSTIFDDPDMDEEDYFPKQPRI